MLIVHVHIKIKPGYRDAFIHASLENASQSVLEPGIARFDLLEHPDDPTRFILQEVYRTVEAPALHKETSHYAKWRDTVAPMMAEPRHAEKYSNIYPEDPGW